MRRYQEVIDWNRYSEEVKGTILHRIEKHMIETLQNKIEIFDIVLLKRKLDKHHISYRTERHPLCWVHSLLRQGADKMRIIEKYGFTIIDERLKSLTPAQLFENLDETIYQLADQAYSE